jgi:transcriptional regulator with XRE-family HTH domain
MNVKQIVGDNVRFLREKRNWTQEELSVISKMSKTFIGDVERAQKTITVVNLERLAKALKVPLSLLVTPNGYKLDK